MESELNPLQAVCNNLCTALKWACYRINRNNNTTIILSKNKEQHLKNYLWIHTSADVNAQVCFHTSCLFISRTNLNENECYWYLYLYIAATNARELQVGYLLANIMALKVHTSTYISIQMHVLLFPLWCFMM